MTITLIHLLRCYAESAKRLTLLWLLTLGCVHFVHAQPQVFSRFDFNTNALKMATIGPNATSINPDTRRRNGKLYMSANCGNNSGFDLVIPNDNNIFDVPSIGMRFRFRKSENFAHFFDRSGMSFYVQGGILILQYRTKDGITPNGTVNYGPIVTGFGLPNDNQFHEYIFEYDEATGLAEIRVDNNVVWFFDGPDNRALDWDSSVDPFVGDIMDGTCNQQGVLDFAEFYIPNQSLPVEFLEISTVWDHDKVKLTWETVQEINNDYFVIERSPDQVSYLGLDSVSSTSQASSEVNFYEYDDNEVPGPGTYWYRLRQVDNDGSTLYSDPVKLILSNSDFNLISIYPNPNQGVFTIKHGTQAENIRIIDVAGNTVYSAPLSSSKSNLILQVNQPNISPGTYFAIIKYPGHQQAIKFAVQ